MKLKTTIHIHYAQWSWEETGKFQVFPAKLDDCEHRTYVGEQEIEVEVPDDYDPRAQQIAALEAQKQKIMADFQKSVTDISRRISELSAVEYTA